MSNVSEPYADLRAENESLRQRVAELEAAERARRRVEETLRQSEERYRVMSEMMSDFAYAIHIDSSGRRTPEWLTGAFTSITGFSHEEFLSSDGWSRSIHPDDYPQVSDLWEQCIQTGRSNVCEYRIFTRESGVRWVRRYARPVWDTVQGRVVLVYCAVQDITTRKETEEALRQSRERYRVISEMMSDLMYALRYDTDGKLVPEWVAGAFTGITGYNAEDFMSATRWRDLTHPDDRQAVYDTWLQSMQSRQDGVCEHRILTKQGEERWVRRYMRPIQNSGDSTYVYGALQDITERKRIEEALQQSEMKARALLDAPADTIYIFMMNRDGIILDANRAFASAMRKPISELIGLYAYDLLPPALAQTRKAHINEAIQSGRMTRFEDKGLQQYYENIVSPILNEAGEVVQVAVFGRDITERKQMEETLRSTKERLTTLLQASPAVIYSTRADNDFAITYVSPNAIETIGYPPEQFTRDPAFWDSLVHPDDVSDMNVWLHTILEEGQNVAEYRIRHADGSYRWIRDACRVICDANEQPLEIIGCCIDITERRLAEDALRASEARYRTLTKNFPNGMVFLFDLDMRYIIAEGKGLEVFGQTTEDFFGKTIWEIGLPEDVCAIVEQRYRAALTGETSVLETQIADFRYDVQVVPVIDSHGDIIAGMSVTRDVTEQRQAEEAVRVSEARLRALVDAIPDLLVRIRTDGTFLDFKPPAEHEQDVPQAAFVGQSIWDVFPHAQAEQMMMYVEKTLQTREFLLHEYRFAVEGMPQDREARYVSSGPDEALVIVRDITERKRQDERVRLLESVVVHSNDAVLITEAEPIELPGPRIVYVNPAFERMTGYSEAEAIGQTPRMLQGPKTDRAELKRIRYALEHWRHIRVELINYRKDGSEFWVELDISPVMDASGVYTHWVAIQRDITERKLADSELRASRALLQGIVDNSPTVIYANNLQGQFTLANRPFINKAGLPDAQHIIGQTIRDIFPPDVAEQMEQDNHIVSTTGKPIQIEGRESLNDDKRTWLTVKFPIFDETGLMTSLGVISTDITESKRAEAKLRATTSRLSTLIENLQAGVLVEDENQQIVLVNHTFCRLFGIPVAPQELIGTDCRASSEASKDLFEEPENFIRRIEQVLHARRLVTSEEIALKDGRTFERDYIPISVESVYAGHLWQYRDITSRKRVDRALRRYTERLQALYEIDQAILSAQSPAAIAHAALNHLRILIPCPIAGVALFDHITRRAHLLALRSNGNQSIDTQYSMPMTKDSPQIDALQRGETLIIDNIPMLDFPLELTREMQALNVNAIVCIPLRIQGELIGSLNLGATKPDILTSDHQTIVSEVATSLAIAIRQARLYEQTLQDAHLKANLLREVNHRVKNNLSAIVGLLFAEQRRADINKQPLYQSIISDLANRVQSLASAHDLLSASEWSPVQLKELIQEISQLALKALPTQPYNPLIINDTSILVTPDQAHNLALIINELATNSVKYAFPVVGDALCLTARITSDNTTIRLEFRDNGPGYPSELLQHGRPYFHVGFELIHNLVQRSLRGRMELLNNNGAVTIIEFPHIPVAKAVIGEQGLEIGVRSQA
jgi:PAS domain S-box-containing protein